jgi:5'(3')-deoxyribonucleotidase
MPKRIFLDLDGVLVDFIRGVHESFGQPYIPCEVTDWYWYKGWGLTTEEVAAKCMVDFWANLHWTPDGREIFAIVKHFCPAKNIFLVTTPMDNVESYAGKMIWVDKNLGREWLDRLFITRTSKEIFARNLDCLLIDDREENCLDFERAGGSTILVPLYHNRLRSDCSRRVCIIEDKLRYFLRG